MPLYVIKKKEKREAEKIGSSDVICLLQSSFPLLKPFIKICVLLRVTKPKKNSWLLSWLGMKFTVVALTLVAVVAVVVAIAAVPYDWLTKDWG